MESDDEDQENINGAPNFGVQDDCVINMHNINIMVLSDEVIRINKQTGQIVPLCNIVHEPIEPTIPQLESWAVADNGASDVLYEANDIWVLHGLDPRVSTCRQMTWLCRVGIFLDYKIAYSKDSECIEWPWLGWFSPAGAIHTRYSLDPIKIYATKRELNEYNHRLESLDTVGITEIGESQAMMTMIKDIYINNLENISTDIDIMHRHSIRGDATRMETYIELGALV